MKFFTGLAQFLFTLNAYSWDGAVTGKVSKVDVTSAENYGFRIVLEGEPALCGNSIKWAYLNSSASNYQTYVSMLLAAKMAQSTVTIYTHQTGSSKYCSIGYISVR
ncbi:hypothetical protein [Marinagarivorans algicola]|uniref:hypothetical protein n=1 Tax=Marinagarivorans algicola TaxID=1513270 RepID=UPI0006B89446|nr:hypothetical protein [Marinagarivorans algicola]